MHIILYLVVNFSRSRRVEILLLGAFVCGLALTNQHTIVLYVVPLVCWMLFLARRCLLPTFFTDTGTDTEQRNTAGRQGRRPFVLFWQLSLVFIAGITPYIYLPIAALSNPVAGSGAM